ncbi:MAG: GNAT family N-acetyltransferase [Chitinophagales bacterium]|nr:GNAT family N-acetyltransferase [Chitinophagales bacterium]
MIKSVNIHDLKYADKILQLQKLSYQTEAELIKFYKIPPLIETLNQLINSTEKFIVYETSNEIVGFLSYQINQEKLEICRLAICPNYFKNGIATKLMMYLSSIENVNQFLVSTAKNNLPATTFYLKNGFIETHKSNVDNLVLVHFVKNI